jgi:hypothetical protein
MAPNVQPGRIKWSDRDAGQKLSVLMLLLVMVACDVFAVWSLVVDLRDGDVLRAVVAVVFVAIWTAWGYGLARGMGVFDARG